MSAANPNVRKKKKSGLLTRRQKWQVGIGVVMAVCGAVVAGLFQPVYNWLVKQVHIILLFVVIVIASFSALNLP